MHRFTLSVALVLLAGCDPATTERAILGFDGGTEDNRATTAVESFSGKVVGVADGDTLTVLVDEKEIKVRLHGIDCPERGQPYGAKAKTFTGDRAFGQVVTVRVIDHDRYGRTVGRVVLPDGADLSALLVGHGLAWHYVQYAPDDEQLASLEKVARQENREIWSDPVPPIPPWDWRKPRFRPNRSTGDQPAARCSKNRIKTAFQFSRPSSLQLSC